MCGLITRGLPFWRTRARGVSTTDEGLSLDKKGRRVEQTRNVAFCKNQYKIRVGEEAARSSCLSPGQEMRTVQASSPLYAGQFGTAALITFLLPSGLRGVFYDGDHTARKTEDRIRRGGRGSEIGPSSERDTQTKLSRQNIN